MAENDRRSNPSFNPSEETMATPGGKREWQRLADSIPSNPKNDPKPHEARKGDMSVRKGAPEEGAPDWRPEGGDR